MKTSLFEYVLPRELIAAVPAQKRDESRLMVLHRADQAIEHQLFKDLIDYVGPGDLLVANDSRVIRARIHGKRMSTGGAVEFLLLERLSAPGDQRDRWRVMCRPAKKLKPGEEVYFSNKQLLARVLHYISEGEREVEFSCPDVGAWLDTLGEVPLPPYIVQRRHEAHIAQPADDAARYQTVYARDPGSVAAPTAGLHFTDELMQGLRSKGAEFAFVTLHVGPGTFKPVETEDVEDHPMHEERFVIPVEAAASINGAKKAKRRLVAVGTTSVRALESISDTTCCVTAGEYRTKLKILPGYDFKTIDALITNFHLPRSTLLMLVSAFAGREFVLRAYEEAVREKYRFYSYGDAMLVL